MRILANKIEDFFRFVGELVVFSFKSFFALYTPPYRIKIIVEQLMHIGIASIFVISVSSFAIGMIFTLQLALELSKFNTTTLIGNIIGQVFSRELSPVFTAFMLIGKNGSSIAAELGTMNLSNQIQAMRTMSVNPIQYLVTPRLIACMFMFPLLSALSTLLGLGGGALVTFGILGVDYAATVDYMFVQLTAWDIITGNFKCFIMSIAVCLICCFLGMREKRTSKDISRDTTKAVVISSVTILLIDFILGKLLIIVGVTS